MPQMMPINWLFLMFLFIIIFMLFNIMNYYIFNIKANKNIVKSNKFNNLNWKW